MAQRQRPRKDAPAHAHAHGDIDDSAERLRSRERATPLRGRGGSVQHPELSGRRVDLDAVQRHLHSRIRRPQDRAAADLHRAIRDKDSYHCFCANIHHRGTRTSQATSPYTTPYRLSNLRHPRRRGRRRALLQAGRHASLTVFSGGEGGDLDAAGEAAACAAYAATDTHQMSAAETQTHTETETGRSAPVSTTTSRVSGLSSSHCAVRSSSALTSSCEYRTPALSALSALHWSTNYP